MSDPGLLRAGRGLDVGEIATMTGVSLPAAAATGRRIVGAAALDRAAPWDLSFLDDERFAAAAAASRAGACFTTAALAGKLPARVVALVVIEPYRAFVIAASALFADTQQPSSLYPAGASAGAQVHPSSRLEVDVTIEPGVVVGPGAEIGCGTVVRANAAIGGAVRIGRNCVIGAGATIDNALLGDRVRVHAGCHIGQNGLGFLGGDGGFLKVPERGRVIIQDDVEIGAGSTIDRGGIRDTIVGEGTKIDNLVRVGHNASVGRHCLVVAQTSISGSATVEDHVVLEARVELNDNVTIGEGARIAASSVVQGDVPAGGHWAGTPARPAQKWFRETMVL